MRVDVYDVDYKYLLPISEQQDWSMNRAIQRIVHQWCALHQAGEDIGVIPVAAAPRRRRR